MTELFKALGDRNRLRIVNLLLDAELCVCEIEVMLQMTQSNVSRHLGKLKQVGLICSSKDAQWIHYKVNDQFQSDHQGLIAFLVENFKSQKIYLDDLERYHCYKDNHLNCQMIKDDKEKVLEIIKLED